MTARERIRKGIEGHDAVIEAAREEIDALAGGLERFKSTDEAYRLTKLIMRECGAILSRLSQRREAVKNLSLLDYHASKNPQAANEAGL